MTLSFREKFHKKNFAGNKKPNLFFFSKHDVIKKTFVSLVYAFLPKKTEDTLKKIFGCLEQMKTKILQVILKPTWAPP